MSMCRYGVTRVVFQPLATLSQRGLGVEVAQLLGTQACQVCRDAGHLSHRSYGTISPFLDSEAGIQRTSLTALYLLPGASGT